jgi:hypothetical protein
MTNKSRQEFQEFTYVSDSQQNTPWHAIPKKC